MRALRGVPLNPSPTGNSVIRWLATIAMVVVAIRVIVWLLEPIALWLLLALVAFVAFRLVRWYRGRW